MGNDMVNQAFHRDGLIIPLHSGVTANVLCYSLSHAQGSAENFFSVGRRSVRIDIIRNFKMVLDILPRTIHKSVLDNFLNSLGPL